MQGPRRSGRQELVFHGTTPFAVAAVHSLGVSVAVFDDQSLQELGALPLSQSRGLILLRADKTTIVDGLQRRQGYSYKQTAILWKHQKLKLKQVYDTYIPQL